ncbi:MAG: diguanylate cyclase [Acidobacteriota bacterium]
MAVTRGGVLWSAGPKGLSRYDGKTFRVVHQQDGLAAGLVTEIAPAGDDELWVCYREPLGVTHLKWTEGLAPSVRHVRASDGLPSDEVFVLGLDSRGNVWAGGDRGAAVIGPDDAIAVIDHTRGLLWDDCSAGAFLAEEDGAVFLGTSRGLTRCDASTPLPAGRDVEAVLLSVRLGGREVRGASDPAIDGSDRSLLVRIAASTVGPRTAFRHRLVGISDDWTESADRTLSYPALPPGSYRLEVACATRHAAPPTAFSFVVRPHVWETAWGRGLLLVPLLLLVGAIVPIRTRALRRRHRELEQAVAARSAELAAKNRELEEASFTEPLTRVRNRRFFAAVVGDDVGRAKRAFKDGGVGRNRDLIFYMVDIDHFKEVNDVYGHRAGDQVLVQTAERLGALLRTTDLLVRWGGEEFLVVARDSDRADGDVLARRILEAFGKPLTLPDGGPIRKTCSVGWAPYPWLTGSPDALPYERVLNLADKALYIAKASGRNNAVGLIPPDEIGDLEDAEPVDHLDGITIRFLRTRGPGAPTS